MDKVQFNNEVVLMRKTVKRVKVQVVKNLTRQIKQLRSKKGKPEELDKNKRRCDRLVEVVQAMKHCAPDDVTYSALVKTPTIKEAMETPRDKALSRLIMHPLFVKRLATFKDLVTPDLLKTKRLRKKVDKGSKEDDGTLTLQLKDKERRETDPSGKSPSEPGDDEDSEDESDEDEVQESFFLSSEKEKSLGNSNLDSNPSSDETLTDLRRSKSEDVGDSSMTSSEDEDNMEDLDKGHQGASVPKVDLPNQTTKHSKNKYIPGISAPISSTLDPVRKDSSNRGRGRGISNRSHSKGPLKNLAPQFHEPFSNRGRGRGRSNNSVSSFRSGSGDSLPSKLNNYQDGGIKRSLQSKNSKPPMEKNEGEQMHPSWLAKKNQRAGEKPVNFAGKKTTFSDG